MRAEAAQGAPAQSRRITKGLLGHAKELALALVGKGEALKECGAEG